MTTEKHAGALYRLSMTGIATLALLFLAATPAAAQEAPPPQSSVINIRISRTIQVVNYRNRGATKIDFQGTALAARAEGQARVESKEGRLSVQAEFKGLTPAATFGSPFLTYVLWAITPEGRPMNLGEVRLNGAKSKLAVTTRLQTFGIIVTAEPYFGVSSPSEVVVLENIVRKDTQGATDTVDAKFELLQRGNYENMKLAAFDMDPNVPLDLYEARNAVRIARAQQAEQFAPDSLAKAVAALAQAEDYFKRKQKQAALTASRDAVQKSEDARELAVKRAEDARIAKEQQEAAEREAKARAEAEAEAQRRAEAEREQQEAQRREAQAREQQEEEARRRAEAERQRLEAEQQRQESEKREAAARAEQAAAEEQAKREREAAEQAEREKQELRATLLAQFNRILPTRDTPRGLVVMMGDVLFDTGKFNLRPAARENLAKLSGIVLSHPGLLLSIEGHTDNVGSDEFNQTLSEKRAEAVRDYLLQQGISLDSMTSVGFGKANPVASNDKPAGRQQNRRVEIVISGEVIGTKIGDKP